MKMIKKKTGIGLALAVLLCGHAASAGTNAPASAIHPELSDMTHLITTPVTLTNSPLLGATAGDVSNRFAKAGFYWQTNGVARVETGFVKFPRRTDYIWHRNLLLRFKDEKVVKVEVVDRPGGEVVIEERNP